MQGKKSEFALPGSKEKQVKSMMERWQNQSWHKTINFLDFTLLFTITYLYLLLFMYKVLIVIQVLYMFELEHQMGKANLIFTYIFWWSILVQGGTTT